jgi:AcrR family transcriptional regulator
MPEPKQVETKRPRRSPETVRALLLESALSLFAQRGYAGTSTREVARLAGVSEALLFRHFGTKVVLFENAVIMPFTRYLDEYADRWAERPTASSSVEGLTRDYIGGLYDLLEAHRELVVALVAAHAHEDGLDTLITGALARPLERVESLTEQEAIARRYETLNPRLATRAFLAMVMGMAVLDSLFQPGGRPRPSRDEIVGEMTALLAFGLENRPIRSKH